MIMRDSAGCWENILPQSLQLDHFSANGQSGEILVK